MDHERPKPKGYVKLKINERAARIAMWLNQNFLLQDGEVNADDDGTLPKISFLCLRNRPNVSRVNKTYVYTKIFSFFRFFLKRVVNMYGNFTF